MTDREIQNCLCTVRPTSNVFTTNFTWTDMGSNPAVRGGRPATDHLSYGKAVTRPRRTAARRGAARLHRTHRYDQLEIRGLTELPGPR
jgi:hypothetical protein